MKRASVLVLALALALSPLAAQRIKRMEFRNQPIADILLALAQSAGVSIVPDETVTGNASFFFSDSDFGEALGRFLASYKLYLVKDGNAYYVSRIRASYDPASDLADLEADDVDIALLVRALSRAVGRTILYDTLPRAPLSINARGLPPQAILEMLARKFPDYRVEADASYFYLRRLPAETVSATGRTGRPAVQREGDRYSLSLEKGRFLDALVDLFKAGGKEYSLLTKSDTALENLYFSGRDFDSLLRLLLEQGNADYAVHEGVYYIFEIQRKDVLKKLRDSEVLPLRFLPAQDLVNLLPSDLGSGSLLKVDKSTNAVILTGSAEEILPLRAFILRLDRPMEGLSYHRYDLKYLKVKDLVALLPPKLLPVSPIVLPEGNSFVALLPDGGADNLGAFINLVDRKTEGFPVRLRYVKNEEFFKNLPPSVSKDELVDSGLPGLVFFTGSEDKRRLFLRELELMDRPKPQIRYELLVVQYQRSQGVEWSKSLTASSVASSPSTFTGELSSLLSLKFDAISLFGYQFALDLSLNLSDSRAQVFADTTLTGLSGQEIKFQNTDTYRYRELEYDEDTGKNQYTGVTSQVTSGLILSVNGWVSGDGMVTMAVSATISKETGDESTTDTGNPPPTTEKVVTTNVRTVSGKPVVIGGLFQKSKDVSVKKIPILGDIPLLGLLFRDIKQSEEDTEMVVYIVPHVVTGDEADAEAVGRRMERFYASYVEGFVP